MRNKNFQTHPSSTVFFPLDSLTITNEPRSALPRRSRQRRKKAKQNKNLIVDRMEKISALITIHYKIKMQKIFFRVVDDSVNMALASQTKKE